MHHDDMAVRQTGSIDCQRGWEKQEDAKQKTRECIEEMKTLDAPDGEDDEPLLPARRAAHRLGGPAHQRQAAARHRSLATARVPSIAYVDAGCARGAMVRRGWGGAVCSLPKHAAADGAVAERRCLLAFRGEPNIAVEYSTKPYAAACGVDNISPQPSVEREIT